MGNRPASPLFNITQTYYLNYKMNTLLKKLILLGFSLSALATLHGALIVETGAGGTYITPVDMTEINPVNNASFPPGSIKFKPGAMFFINPGFQHGRYQLSLDFDFSKSDVKSIGLLGNGHPQQAGTGSLYIITAMPTFSYTLLQGDSLSWNISGGAGISRINSVHIGVQGGTDWSTAWDTEFSFKLGSALKYDLSSKLALSLGLNFVQTDKTKLNTNSATQLDFRRIEQTQFYLSTTYKL
jgi:hypothetical protein